MKFVSILCDDLLLLLTIFFTIGPGRESIYGLKGKEANFFIVICFLFSSRIPCLLHKFGFNSKINPTLIIYYTASIHVTGVYP